MGKGRVRLTRGQQENIRQQYRRDTTQTHADLAEWAFSHYGERPSAKAVSKFLTRKMAPYARPDARVQQKVSRSGLRAENNDVNMEDATVVAGVMGEPEGTAGDENKEEVAAACIQFPAPNELQATTKQLEEELSLLKILVKTQNEQREQAITELKILMKTQNEQHAQAITELKKKHDADMNTLRKEFDVENDNVCKHLEAFRQPVGEMKCFMEKYIKAPRAAQVLQLAAQSPQPVESAVDTAALSPEPVKEPVPSANPTAEQRTSAQAFKQAKTVVITPPVKQVSDPERIARDGGPSTEEETKPTTSKQLQRIQAHQQRQ